MKKPGISGSMKIPIKRPILMCPTAVQSHPINMLIMFPIFFIFSIVIQSRVKLCSWTQKGEDENSSSSTMRSGLHFLKTIKATNLPRPSLQNMLDCFVIIGAQDCRLMKYSKCLLVTFPNRSQSGLQSCWLILFSKLAWATKGCLFMVFRSEDLSRSTTGMPRGLWADSLLIMAVG